MLVIVWIDLQGAELLGELKKRAFVGNCPESCCFELCVCNNVHFQTLFPNSPACAIPLVFFFLLLNFAFFLYLAAAIGSCCFLLATLLKHAAHLRVQCPA